MLDKGQPTRLPHAILDLPSRRAKGEKIARLLRLDTSADASEGFESTALEERFPLRILEVGTGSGGIANWFATRPHGRFIVDAVDVVDNRQVWEGYRYQTVQGITLPFGDEAFDIVLSNHVIEHVGSLEAQKSHLAELQRVMAPGARGYLAVPNRWMLVEPHFHLAFLSWLPERLRSSYVRLRRRGVEYDCRPLTKRLAERLLVEAGFEFQQHCGDALRLTFDLENRSDPIYRYVLSKIPDSTYDRLAGIFPTLVYTFSRVRSRTRQ
jgi:SAM-dependent methyltransferase